MKPHRVIGAGPSEYWPPAVDRHDPRVLEPADDLRLQEEPRPGLRVAGEPLADLLQRHLAIQLAVLGPIDLAEPADFVEGDDPVSALAPRRSGPAVPARARIIRLGRFPGDRGALVAVDLGIFPGRGSSGGGAVRSSRPPGVVGLLGTQVRGGLAPVVEERRDQVGVVWESSDVFTRRRLLADLEPEADLGLEVGPDEVGDPRGLGRGRRPSLGRWGPGRRLQTSVRAASGPPTSARSARSLRRDVRPVGRSWFVPGPGMGRMPSPGGFDASWTGVILMAGRAGLPRNYSSLAGRSAPGGFLDEAPGDRLGKLRPGIRIAAMARPGRGERWRPRGGSAGDGKGFRSMDRIVVKVPESVEELCVVRLGLVIRKLGALPYAARLGREIGRSAEEAIRSGAGLLSSSRSGSAGGTSASSSTGPASRPSNPGRIGRRTRTGGGARSIGCGRRAISGSTTRPSSSRGIRSNRST